MSVDIPFGSCCCYAFATVFPFLASVPGSGNLSTTVAAARLTPVPWRLGRQGVASGRLRSDSIGAEWADFLFPWTFALDFAHVSTLSWLGTGQVD